MLVSPSKCVGTGNCVSACPMGAIRVEGSIAHINQDECVDCGACIRFATAVPRRGWYTTRGAFSR